MHTQRSLELKYTLLTILFLGVFVAQGIAGEWEDLDARFKRGRGLNRQGEYAAGLAELESALKTGARVIASQPEWKGTLYHNMAISYDGMGNYAKAEEYYRAAMKIHESALGPNDIGVGDALDGLANIYHDTQQWDKVEPLRLRALKIFERHEGPNGWRTVTEMGKLGSYYQNVGRYKEAETLLTRELQILEAKPGSHESSVAAALNNLALVYERQHRYDECEKALLRSLTIYERTVGPDHPRMANGLLNLGMVYSRMKEFEKAIPPLQRCLRIREARLGPNHPFVSDVLSNLAVNYGLLGQRDRERELLEQSLVIVESTYGPQHNKMGKLLHTLGVCDHDEGKFESAAFRFDQSRRIARSYAAQVLPALGEQEQLTFLHNADRVFYEAALTFALQQRDKPTIPLQSLGWISNGKSLAEQTLSQRALLMRDSADPAVSKMAEQLLEVRNRLASKSMEMPPSGKESAHRKELNDLVETERQLVLAVQRAAGRAQVENQWVEAAAVRDAVPAGAVLVDIVRFQIYRFEHKGKELYWNPGHYVAWVVPPAGKGNVTIVDLGVADEIDVQTAKARYLIEVTAAELNQGRDETAAEKEALKELSTLAARVLKPLEPYLEGAEQVILSPDTGLWLAPWAALPLSDGKYAVEKWSIRFVASGRDLVSEKAGIERKVRAARPNIFADPDYNLDSRGVQTATQAVLRGKENEFALRSSERLSAGLVKVARLPGTGVEAKLIAPSLEKFAGAAPTLYTERYALEGVVKSVASPQVLVLSTHGFYEQSRDDDVESSEAGSTAENPLLRCGLLLAGCNQPQSKTDDGILTGMEILGCDLRGTELVVLSACQTGMGEVQYGNGVAGLRQAFQLAGAKAVVSTLWRIPDKETADLMYHFFEQLSAGKSKAEALRNAQLKLIEARRESQGAAHPMFWAAFTLTGK